MCTEDRAVCQVEILLRFRRGKSLKNSHMNYYLTTITIDLIFIGEPEGNKRLYKGDF